MILNGLDDLTNFRFIDGSWGMIWCKVNKWGFDFRASKTWK